MALAQLVYPGAVHTRLHHALGAFHLMGQAIEELKAKGVPITKEEESAARAAILLHDIGHGPYSHALEGKLVEGIGHEAIGTMLMKQMDRDLGGRLGMAIEVFQGTLTKKFLHQLVSGQLDVDRMDYLTRDSFFTGVTEGVIGYHRILKMLAVKDGNLVVEEKGIYSVEKFLVARRQMYWQVYLHKTVVCAETMLVNIIKRVKQLASLGDASVLVGGALDFFIDGKLDAAVQEEILSERFCALDDTDCLFAIKIWRNHPDTVLARLCAMLLDRQLLKTKLQSTPFEPGHLEALKENTARKLGICLEESSYFVYSGKARNTMYKSGDDKINILFKDGEIKDIAKIDNPLVHQTISSTVEKYYLCWME